MSIIILNKKYYFIKKYKEITGSNPKIINICKFASKT